MRNKKLIPGKKPVFAFLLLFLLFVLSSCFKDQFDFDNIAKSDWNSEWAVPVVHSTLGLEDLVKDSNDILIEGEDGLLKLVYQSERMFSVYAKDLVDIPDQNKDINKNYNLPEMQAGEIKVIPVDLSFDFDTDKPGQRLDSIYLKSGTLKLHIVTNLNKNEADIKIRIPSILKQVNRDTLEVNFNADYEGENQIIRDTTLEMNNYILFPEHLSKSLNKLKIMAYITVTGDNNPDLSPYYLDINLDMDQLEFSHFFGYIGQYSYDLSDSIAFDFFNINQIGSFVFAQGSINFNIYSGNSYGMPIQVDITEFRAHADGIPPVNQDIHIFGQGVPDIINLNYPNYSQVGLVAQTPVNTGNSNIHEAVNIYPDWLTIKLGGLSNPENDSTIKNFVLDTSRFDMKMNLEMSLFGAMQNFTVIDTVGFEFPDLDNVEECLFRVITHNSFPLNARLQISFADSAYYYLGDLLADPTEIISAAPVGPPPDYRVTSPTLKINEIILDKPTIEAVKSTRYMIITAFLDTSGNDIVKIYNDSDIDVKVGLKIKLKL